MRERSRTFHKLNTQLRRREITIFMKDFCKSFNERTLFKPCDLGQIKTASVWRPSLIHHKKRHNSVVTSDLSILDCIIIWDDQKYRTVRLYFVGQEKQRGRGVETALVQTKNILKQCKKRISVCTRQRRTQRFIAATAHLKVNKNKTSNKDYS